MVFGVQKVVVQESYTISQKSRFVYSLFCIEYKCLQAFNGLDMWDKCVTWIANELSWRYLTHTFLTHQCMFGLAQVQVRLALHIFNTNNSALLMFECSFTLVILHLWKLLCYFELVLWSTQVPESSWDIENT